MARLPAEQFQCKIDVELDIPYSKVSVCRPLRLEATVGVHKLHIQSNIKVSHFSDIVLSRVSPLILVIYLQTGTLANNEDPDEMLHNAAFHRGLHCLLRKIQSSGTDIEISICETFKLQN